MNALNTLLLGKTNLTKIFYADLDDPSFFKSMKLRKTIGGKNA